MSEFNKELSELYKKVATDQKNKKGITHKFDRPEHANFRGKIGVNDTGIPLTPKAAIKKRNNRAGYHYPQHLKNINERRRKDAMARHGIIDVDDPFKVKILVVHGTLRLNTPNLEERFFMGVMSHQNQNK